MRPLKLIVCCLTAALLALVGEHLAGCSSPRVGSGTVSTMVTAPTPPAFKQQAESARGTAEDLNQAGADTQTHAQAIVSASSTSDGAASSAQQVAPQVAPQVKTIHEANASIRHEAAGVVQAGQTVQQAAPKVESYADSLDNGSSKIAALQAQVDHQNSIVLWFFRALFAALAVWGVIEIVQGVRGLIVGTAAGSLPVAVGAGIAMIVIGALGLLAVTAFGPALAFVQENWGWCFGGLAGAAGLFALGWRLTHAAGTRWKSFATDTSAAFEASKKGVLLAGDDLRDYMGEKGRQTYQKIKDAVVREANHIVQTAKPANPTSAPPPAQ